MGQVHHDGKKNGHPELDSGSSPVLSLELNAHHEISQTLL